MDEYDKQPSTRVRILYTAAKLTEGDRNKSYGNPVENMQDIARAWTTHLQGRRLMCFGDYLRGEDVAHMMTLMKIARTYNGDREAHPDNYIDGACYQGIAGECAEAERDNNS